MNKIKCVKINPNNNELDGKLYEYYTSFIRFGYAEFGEEKICMPEIYESISDDIEHFQVNDSDIFVCSHPKTGTTWMQELVWMMINDMDQEKGKEFILQRFPFLEYKGLVDYRHEEAKELQQQHPIYVKESIIYTRDFKANPRLIKTHLPWSLMPKQIRDGTKKPKIIYVYRNPKDTCVSFYNHSKLLDGYRGDLETFCKFFLAGRLMYGPFWKNVLGFWQKRNESNVLFIRYEDMIKNLTNIVQQVAQFVGKKMDRNQIAELVEHLSFDNMKNNKSCNYEQIIEANQKLFKTNLNGHFMRSGKIGSYKAELSTEIIQEIDRWTEENIKGTGFIL